MPPTGACRGRLELDWSSIMIVPWTPQIVRSLQSSCCLDGRALRRRLALPVVVLLAGMVPPAVLGGDAQDVLTIHYHRFEQDYDQASLWTWDEHLVRAPSANEIQPSGRDEFGIVFKLDVGQYGKPGDRIGLLPRLKGDWQFKDGPDRFWQPSLGREVYIVQGRPDVYRERPDVRPQVASASLDDDSFVTVRFSHRVPVAEFPRERFSITAAGGGTFEVASVEPRNVADGRTAEYGLKLTSPVDFARDSCTIGVRDMGSVPLRIGRILHRPDRFYDANVQLGASYAADATTFRVFAPTARSAFVIVADAAEGDAGRAEHAMRAGDKGVWQATVQGDLAGKFYAYRLEAQGLDPKAEVTDIYATCTQNRAVRSLIVDSAKTDPPGFREQTYTFNGTPADAIVCELHVRDFSIAANSGIQHKGKYLGLSEAGAQLVSSPGVTTGLDHLCEMGVTHVQILPIQDFENDETRDDAYAWGYMPVNFNSPDGWYAQSVTGPGRIVEFKQAVETLHAHGIGVVMDVVYNHTAGPASFERLVPGYYHRMNADGTFSNGSGCGNEFMSEAPMGRKFILDSLKYWVREYGVDGFRFDLMGLIDLETMKLIKAELSAMKPGILVYGEPWTGGATPLNPITGHPQVRGTGLGAFNDHFRDAIKGERDGGGPGFVQVGDRAPGIRLGLEGGIHDWSADPAESINYFEAHDNLTAWDKMLQSMPQASDAERRRAMRFGSLILLTSQGTVFLQSGQEFCRSKQGVSNSYNQPDAINQVDWSAKVKNADVYAYVRGMIAIRKAHPALRLAKRSDIEQRSYFLDAPNDRSFTWRIKGDGLAGESAREILVLLNGSGQSARFALPAQGWKVYADADRAGLEALREVGDAAEVPAHSGMLLMR
jgi:pullulanase